MWLGGARLRLATRHLRRATMTAPKWAPSSTLASSRTATSAAATAAATATAAAAAVAVALVLAESTDAAATSCMSLAEWHAAPCVDETANTALQKFAGREYVRIDRLLMGGDVDSGSGHVIFDTLGARVGAVPMYRIFSKVDGSETVGVVTLGADGCDGHRGIVHGGVTAMLLDNTLGWANAVGVLASNGELEATIRGQPLASDTVQTFGMTAYLHLEYRSPCLPGSTVVITCVTEKAEGRKRFLKGEVRDAATGKLIAEATSLFVRPRPKLPA